MFEGKVTTECLTRNRQTDVRAFNPKIWSRDEIQVNYLIPDVERMVDCGAGGIDREAKVTCKFHVGNIYGNISKELTGNAR